MGILYVLIIVLVATVMAIYSGPSKRQRQLANQDVIITALAHELIPDAQLALTPSETRQLALTRDDVQIEIILSLSTTGQVLEVIARSPDLEDLRVDQLEQTPEHREHKLQLEPLNITCDLGQACSLLWGQHANRALELIPYNPPPPPEKRGPVVGRRDNFISIEPGTFTFTKHYPAGSSQYNATQITYLVRDVIDTVTQLAKRCKRPRSTLFTEFAEEVRTLSPSQRGQVFAASIDASEDQPTYIGALLRQAAPLDVLSTMSTHHLSRFNGALDTSRLFELLTAHVHAPKDAPFEPNVIATLTRQAASQTEPNELRLHAKKWSRDHFDGAVLILISWIIEGDYTLEENIRAFSQTSASLGVPARDLFYEELAKRARNIHVLEAIVDLASAHDNRRPVHAAAQAIADQIYASDRDAPQRERVDVASARMLELTIRDVDLQEARDEWLELLSAFAGPTIIPAVRKLMDTDGLDETLSQQLIALNQRIATTHDIDFASGALSIADSSQTSQGGLTLSIEHGALTESTPET